MSTIGSSLSKGDDGTPIINRTVLAQLSGIRKQMTRAEYDAAVTAERTRITNNGTGIYQAGEQFEVIGELGVRGWTIGGSAAASHARAVTLPGGKITTLGADTNTVTAVSGTPSGGNAGDVKVDTAAGLYYINVSGTWGTGIGIVSSTAAIAPPFIPHRVPVILASAQAISNSSGAAATTSTIDTTGASLLVVAVCKASNCPTPFTDSKGNTWVAVGTSIIDSSGGGSQCPMFYTQNPIVGTGHTFTLAGTSPVPNGTLDVLAFNNTLPSSAFDSYNQIKNFPSNPTSSNTGVVTPIEDGELIVFCAQVGNLGSTDVGTVVFSNSNATGSYGLLMGYLIQTYGTPIAVGLQDSATQSGTITAFRTIQI